MRGTGNGPLGFLTPTLLLGVLVALFVLIFQIDNLEDRFIKQSKQLRELGEASDRVAARVDALAEGGLVVGGATTKANRYADVELRHPEAPNFLGESDLPRPPADVPRDGVLVRGWSTGDPKSFNVIIENSGYLNADLQRYVGNYIASRNSFTDPDLWHGELAWRVEVTDDYQEFTIYLHQGVKWHTPSGVDLDDPKYAWLAGEHEFTAHDLAFTLDMLMHPQVENGFIKGYYEDLEEWEALDDYTFRVRWKRSLQGNLESTLSILPVPEFLWAFDERGERFPEETIGLRFNQHWYAHKGFVGTGPYRMTVYEPGVRMVYERNEDYFGWKPPIQRMEWPIYTDAKRTLLMLKSGEIGYGGLSPSDYKREILDWQDEPKSSWPKNSPFLNGQIECKKIDRPAYAYLGWNADRPMFADKRVRRAMTYALDRKRIIEEIYVGLGKVAIGPFLPTGPYMDPNVDPLDFDLDKAAALLREAGWEDSDGDGLLDRDLDPNDADDSRSPFEFTYLTSAGAPEALASANVFQQELLKIGVRMKIDTAEWSLLQKKIDEKDFDVYTAGWLIPWSSDPFQLWHSSQADIPKGSNRVGFRNDRADEIIETLRTTFDRGDRIQLLRELHRLIYDEQAYTFFRVQQSVSCWQKNVKGVRWAITYPRTNALPWWVEPEAE